MSSHEHVCTLHKQQFKNLFSPLLKIAPYSCPLIRQQSMHMFTPVCVNIFHHHLHQTSAAAATNETKIDWSV